MKSIRLMLSITSLAALCLCMHPVHGQRPPSGAAGKVAMGLIQRLHLTPAQQQEITQRQQRYIPQAMALQQRMMQNPNDPITRQKLVVLGQKMALEMRGVLNPSQRKTFDQFVANARERMLNAGRSKRASAGAHPHPAKRHPARHPHATHRKPVRRHSHRS